MMINNFSSLDAESLETFRCGLDLVELFRVNMFRFQQVLPRLELRLSTETLHTEEFENLKCKILISCIFSWISLLARAAKRCVMIWTDFVDYLFLNHNHAG